MADVMLYFGSFNPVHCGHIAIAEYVLRRGLADELWFVVSPRNPLKPPGMLADEDDRLEMVRIAIAGSACAERIKACNVEFGLPRPSYTIDTLRVLEERFPEDSFSLLVGSDIIPEFDRWKEWRALLDNYEIYVYPRPGYTTEDVPEMYGGKFMILDGAPMLECSSTEIRRRVAAGEPVSGMVPAGVTGYIEKHSLWTTK